MQPNLEMVKMVKIILYWKFLSSQENSDFYRKSVFRTFEHKFEKKMM